MHPCISARSQFRAPASLKLAESICLDALDAEPKNRRLSWRALLAEMPWPN
jgi:hypothetical protein